ncbi:histidine kinase [[Pseudomonas] boreopolis]|uniref:histidine kinase n=1 Tax=Xanthomonas boreopolis TaxID=86183 RepID=UPI003D477F8B
MPGRSAAAGHRSDLPEVTFGGGPIAGGRACGQHPHMPRFLRELLEPMSLAGLCTVAAVALSFGVEASPHGALRWLLLGAFAVLLHVHELLPSRWHLRHAALLVQGAAAVALIWLEPRAGTAPVLLVVLVAQAAMRWPRWAVLAFAVVLNTGMYAALAHAGFERKLLIVAIYSGFEAFAALAAHYAVTATRARDALARVNADLLATRALLADSARDAERLRLARELHDVAGHKLTAMRINLRMLAADPELAGRAEIAAAESLSAELLADIRRVVQSLRDDDRGLDLETALRALASPFPRPRLQLAIAPQVCVTDPAVAETVLRLVQEALTNAARHADAAQVQVRIAREDGQLRIDIEDDGRAAATIREGNGIAGMRERLAALRGRLELGRTARGGLHLSARLPA